MPCIRWPYGRRMAARNPTQRPPRKCRPPGSRGPRATQASRCRRSRAGQGEKPAAARHATRAPVQHPEGAAQPGIRRATARRRIRPRSDRRPLTRLPRRISRRPNMLSTPKKIGTNLLQEWASVRPAAIHTYDASRPAPCWPGSSFCRYDVVSRHVRQPVGTPMAPTKLAVPRSARRSVADFT
jgi:hypothetical protein